ncbi:hypothetical protein D3C80_1561530 [compost metagenome]
MPVRLDEARQHQFTAGIQQPGGRAGVRHDAGEVAHADDAFAADGHSLGPGPVRVDGVDTGVVEDEVCGDGHGNSLGQNVALVLSCLKLLVNKIFLPVSFALCLRPTCTVWKRCECERIARAAEGDAP